jgi:hypothetical protein
MFHHLYDELEFRIQAMFRAWAEHYAAEYAEVTAWEFYEVVRAGRSADELRTAGDAWAVYDAWVIFRNARTNTQVALQEHLRCVDRRNDTRRRIFNREQ